MPEKLPPLFKENFITPFCTIPILNYFFSNGRGAQSN